MKINGKQHQSVWVCSKKPPVISVFDQRLLPFKTSIVELDSTEKVIWAIQEMVVRGAPLIGAVGAFGVAIACHETQNSANPDDVFKTSVGKLKKARPTAVDLEKAVDFVLKKIEKDGIDTEKVLLIAEEYAENSKEQCRMIGEYGAEIIRDIFRKKNQKTVNILTHCNAGWLATVDYGTATAPIYKAFEMGIDIHVWVDETRPRNQGANLTAFELMENGIPHTVIADNTGGHLMQNGMVDLVITGTDRVLLNGDVVNKIGTYLKALAAFDNGIPFYIAAPSGSIDFVDAGYHIEERDPDEVKFINGVFDGKIEKVLIMLPQTPVKNFAFDATPARLVSGLITEKGICHSSKSGIKSLFPEYFA